MNQITNLEENEKEYRGKSVFYDIPYQTVEDRKRSEIFGHHETIQCSPPTKEESMPRNLREAQN